MSDHAKRQVDLNIAFAREDWNMTTQKEAALIIEPHVVETLITQIAEGMTFDKSVLLNVLRERNELAARLRAIESAELPSNVPTNYYWWPEGMSELVATHMSPYVSRHVYDALDNHARRLAAEAEKNRVDADDNLRLLKSLWNHISGDMPINKNGELWKQISDQARRAS